MHVSKIGGARIISLDNIQSWFGEMKSLKNLINAQSQQHLGRDSGTDDMLIYLALNDLLDFMVHRLNTTLRSPCIPFFIACFSFCMLLFLLLIHPCKMS